MKTVFLLSGFDTKETAVTVYKNLLKAIAAKGYKVVPVDISWKHTTINQFTDKFVKFYNQHKGTENIVIGNSFGAVAALLSAAQLKPREVYLCSLSPFFKEDIDSKWPSKWIIKYLGKRRLNEIEAYNFNKLSAELNKTSIKFKVIYGQKENVSSPKLVARAKSAARQLKNSELIEVPNAPHNLSDETYYKAVAKMLD